MLQKLKTPIIIVVTAILTQLAGYAVHASMPDALLAAGTTRYAAAIGTTFETIQSTDGWVDLPGMTKYITIPAGKTADVIVIFCGTPSTSISGSVYARVTIRGSAALPDYLPLLSSGDTVASQCGVFYKSNVTAGSPPVIVQWSVTGPGTPVAAMNWRSMLVIVNTH